MENRLERTLLWSGLQKLLRIGLVVSSVMVTTITFAAVITRALNINFLGYEEILIIFAFWLYMMGAAYGSYERSHITADILVVSMPDNVARAIVTMLRNLLTLGLGIVFLVWAYQLFDWTIEMQQKTPVWRIPVTVSQSSLLFGLGIITFYNLVYMYDEVKLFILKFVKKEIPRETKEEERQEV
jgi:TRAP-type C4-dicarboxylate transport system permease small subunit